MAKNRMIKDVATWSRWTCDFSPRTYAMLEEIMRDYGMTNKAEVVRMLIREKYEALTIKRTRDNETKGVKND